MTYALLEKEIIGIYEREHPPEAAEMISLTAETNDHFMREDPDTRPRDESGLPGGIVFLNRDLPCILVPDLHARLDFFLSVLLRGDGNGANALKRLLENEVQIVCLGDGMHSEGRAYGRWNAAAREFLNNYSEHGNMDDE